MLFQTRCNVAKSGKLTEIVLIVIKKNVFLMVSPPSISVAARSSVGRWIVFLGTCVEDRAYDWRLNFFWTELNWTDQMTELDWTCHVSKNGQQIVEPRDPAWPIMRPLATFSFSFFHSLRPSFLPVPPSSSSLLPPRPSYLFIPSSSSTLFYPHPDLS